MWRSAIAGQSAGHSQHVHHPMGSVDLVCSGLLHFPHHRCKRGCVGFYVHRDLGVEHDTGGLESLVDELCCLLWRQAGYVDVAQKVEGNIPGIGYPGVQFHFRRVVNQKVQQVAGSDEQALLLGRRTGRKRREKQQEGRESQ